MPAEPPRFLADRMVGTLAKWLRILGYDTVHMPEVSPASVKCAVGIPRIAKPFLYEMLVFLRRRFGGNDIIG